ncbi:hypothetical protein [Tanticharoenia sakaeratensis]|uniref:Lipoprotein n=1 Tax=Tanticharoenia sakaeratensis NBRC 103193 TaxID=1231623 RepID=A0A0D6MHZ0_9PROT|nr:hypothetical protein [Tanticharoenia sakaeratensis]GAN53090.1 hypothetical protein Tasa_005_005 [Tanticharoenia sakaeratensis NBRC 103193]GBQ20482.1 hypothetical protein AA103193_1394 [Tanticharoenia sakaeratensis NBRC 103193]
MKQNDDDTIARARGVRMAGRIALVIAVAGLAGCQSASVPPSSPAASGAPHAPAGNADVPQNASPGGSGAPGMGAPGAGAP